LKFDLLVVHTEQQDLLRLSLVLCGSSYSTVILSCTGIESET